MRLNGLGITLAVAMFAGCTSDLDRKMMVAREKYHTANQVFASACDVFNQGYDHLATTKHELQRESIHDKWSIFLKDHTNGAGELVSRKADGSIGPMSVDFLADAMERREEAMMALAADVSDTAAFSRNFAQAIGTFKAKSDALMTTEANVQETKESAQAVLDGALTALGGVAAGAGIGIAVAP